MNEWLSRLEYYFLAESTPHNSATQSTVYTTAVSTPHSVAQPRQSAAVPMTLCRYHGDGLERDGKGCYAGATARMLCTG